MNVFSPLKTGGYVAVQAPADLGPARFLPAGTPRSRQVCGQAVVIPSLELIVLS